MNYICLFDLKPNVNDHKDWKIPKFFYNLQEVDKAHFTTDLFSEKGCVIVVYGLTAIKPAI